MNKDELLAIAREAGFLTGEMMGGDGFYKFPLIQPVQGNNCVVEVEKLIEIVRNAERRKHQADIEMWKAQAAQAERWRGMALAKDPMQPGKVVQEIQREAAAYERQKRQEAELMAECMDMVRQDLIDAGIIDKSVPPMMVPEAIASAINSRVSSEREACAQLCEQSDRYRGSYFAQKIRERGE